jgi:hypothetical protein
MSKSLLYTTNIDRLMHAVKATLDTSIAALPLYRHPLYVGVALPDTLPPLGMFKDLGLKGILTNKVAAFNEAVEAKDWEQCLWLTERPFRMDFLFNLLESDYDISEGVRAELTKAVWMDCESPHVNKELWMEWFDWLHQYQEASLHLTANWTHLYTADEWAARNQLVGKKASPKDEDPTIVVYRGTCTNEGAEFMERYGLSWTLDRDRAIWFAQRFAGCGERGAPMLLTAEVVAKNTIGPWQGRGEDEMVLPYDMHRVVKQVLK